MRLVYRPQHPLANENGFVDRELVGSDSIPWTTGVISDEMAETRHMADGQLYTSKAKFRNATRAYGCVEIGNELEAATKPRKPTPLDRGARREAIRQAIRDLSNR